MEDEAADAFNDWATQYEWTFAKTMADSHPHEYLHRSTVPDDEEVMYESFIAFIREYGYEETYAGDQYTCYDMDGYKYWTMGIPITETTIINRRSYDGYDIITELAELGEDPANHVDITEYERGKRYGAAERTNE